VAVPVQQPVPVRQQAAAASPIRLSVASSGTHVVRPGETLYSLGRTYQVSPFAIADLNQLPHTATLTIGQKLRVPGEHSMTAAAAPVPAKPSTPIRIQSVAVSQPATQTATAAPGQSAVASNTPAGAEPALPDTADQPPAETVDASQPAFRWPVNGPAKVISGFGVKANGLRNEGVNISVPEGTAVKAAESGMVAYAGNELKGYGNLILIRHDGGWVTAYAHNKELLVKRGDTVKRGDIIARSGQTGSVDAPQLHFEVRKGATAMDPQKFFGAASASAN
jgi:murein DD-endopeptidase MepM/ murein hydrolase activator NlpD